MITYLIRTSFLDRDERFLKTYDFLKISCEEVSVFAIVRDTVSFPQPCVQQRLKTRKLGGDGRFIVLKYLEMMLVSALHLIRHGGRRWYANYEFMPLQLVGALFRGSGAKPIWDLHEMPGGLLVRNSIMRHTIAFLLRRSAVIVCNDSRRKALERIFRVDLSDALVLRNYPGRRAMQIISEARASYLSDTSPEEDAKNLVIIGGVRPGRYVRESVEVIDALRKDSGLDLRVTLVGGPSLDYPADFVESTGFLSFEDLAGRTAEGLTTLCFYRRNSLNNTLCEPNRFYQAIAAGQYVLTFDHPSLDEIAYPRHVTIDEENFAPALKAALLSIIEGDTGRGDGMHENASALRASDLAFESQLGSFERWLAS